MELNPNEYENWYSVYIILIYWQVELNLVIRIYNRPIDDGGRYRILTGGLTPAIHAIWPDYAQIRPRAHGNGPRDLGIIQSGSRVPRCSNQGRERIHAHPRRD